MQEAFDSKPHHRQMQNAVTVTAVDNLALNRATVTSLDDSFICKLDDWSVTNQKRSGRCWIFAGTNLLRVGAMKKMNLKDFEFSQSYIFFWDSRLFDYESVYGTRFTLNKADRLIYHQSRMNHAMLFTGVDVVDDQPRRWRVENSWSNESGRKGFFIMDDSWFEIAAHKSYLPEDLQKALTLKPIVLPPWDPMGSLAYREFARTY